MQIVENSRALVDTLFNREGTADGYVVKRGKWWIDLFLRGEKVRLNCHGVLCRGSLLPCGRMWWTFANMDIPSSEVKEMAEQLKRDIMWVGGERRYQFL